MTGRLTLMLGVTVGRAVTFLAGPLLWLVGAIVAIPTPGVISVDWLVAGCLAWGAYALLTATLIWLAGRGDRARRAAR